MDPTTSTTDITNSGNSNHGNNNNISNVNNNNNNDFGRLSSKPMSYGDIPPLLNTYPSNADFGSLFRTTTNSLAGPSTTGNLLSNPLPSHAGQLLLPTPSSMAILSEQPNITRGLSMDAMHFFRQNTSQNFSILTSSDNLLNVFGEGNLSVSLEVQTELSRHTTLAPTPPKLIPSDPAFKMQLDAYLKDNQKIILQVKENVANGKFSENNSLFSRFQSNLDAIFRLTAENPETAIPMPVLPIKLNTILMKTSLFGLSASSSKTVLFQ